MTKQDTKGLLSHPLFVAFMTALFTAVATWIFTGWQFRNSRPIAKIVPESVSVNAADSIAFDARGSTDPENGVLRFEWHVNGRTFDKATVASCEKTVDDLMINCRFATPGTHVVSLTAIDEKDLEDTAPASVQVKLPGGYVGFVIQFGEDNKDRNLIRAFNHAVDWPKVQTLIGGKPIVLFDPDKKEPIFAVGIKRSIEKAKQFFILSGRIEELKIIGPILPKAVSQIKQDLLKIGMAVRILPIISAQSSPALHMGVGNSGFVRLSGMDEFEKYYK